MKRRDMLIGAAMSSAAGVALAAAGTAMAQTPAAAPPAPAAGGVGTLDRIIKEKKIRVTAEVTSPPFGILDKDNQPDGSEIATARQLAKDMGVELELVQVTGPQRIPALLSDRADLAISSLSITTDRAKTVWFSSPHGALSIVIGGGKNVNIKSAADLAGKKIGMTRATLEEQVVPKVAPPGTPLKLVYTGKFAPRWKTVLGMRAEHWDAFNGLTHVPNYADATKTVLAPYPSRREDHVSPKAAVSWQWLPDTLLKASLGRAVRTAYNRWVAGIDAPRARWSARRTERVHIAEAHREIYEAALR